MLDKSLVTHCAPTLASLKTGSLFTVLHLPEESLCRQIDHWNFRLKGKGVYLTVLKRGRNGTLLYVFRPQRLTADLAAAAAAFGLLLRLLRLPIVIEMLRRELLRHRRFRTRQRYAPRFIVVKMIIHNSPLCGSASADPVIQNDFTGKCQREHSKSGLFHQQPQVVPAGADLKVRNGTARQHFPQCVQR